MACQMLSEVANSGPQTWFVEMIVWFEFGGFLLLLLFGFFWRGLFFFVLLFGSWRILKIKTFHIKNLDFQFFWKP